VRHLEEAEKKEKRWVEEWGEEGVSRVEI